MISSQATLLEQQWSSNGMVSYLLFQTETKIPFLEGQFMMIECLLRSGELRKKPYSIATDRSSMESNNRIGFYVKKESV
jgi:predicted ferric reductase